MKPSLYVPVIDNGGGLSRTSWAMSMMGFCLSEAVRDRKIVFNSISYPYPDGACNIATADFLDSGCDRMLIIDTDEAFEPRHTNMLLSHDVPFVAGMYCKKKPGFELVVDLLPDTKFPSDPNVGDPLFEVARVARGFLSVHRSVFKKMADTVPSYTDPETGREQKLFWQCLPGGHSEDFAFCDKWRSLGGKVMVDRRIVVWHDGNARYPIPGTY